MIMFLKRRDYLCYMGSFLSDTYKLTFNPKETRLAENLSRECPKMAKTSENEKESLDNYQNRSATQLISHIWSQLLNWENSYQFQNKN